jgi:enoyl-CoA hydratase
MADELVHLERRDDGVAVLTLDHPKVNALSSALLDQLRDRARDLINQPPGAVVVTGGDRLFAAGAEISEFGGPEEAEIIGGRFRGALTEIAAIPRVTIASVSGYALGGGCELAIACDFRIASQKAKFGQPEILLGIIPGGGGTQRIPRLIGTARAKHLILTGRQVGADEALAIGLVDEVVAPDELWDRTLALAAEFAAGPVVAHGLAKRAIDVAFDGTIEQGLLFERDRFIESFRSEDSQIGVQRFLEEGPGKATFRGR